MLDDIQTRFAPRLPLLVTGITGVAGFNALAYFQRRYPGRVIGIRPIETFRLNGPGIVPLDTEDRAGLRELFDAHRFRAVLNCAGNCALKSCELDPAMAERLNVESAAAIVENATRHGARLVHLSSDLVYSGAGAGGYVETDPVDPVTVYGRTMADGERIVLDADPSAAILRIALPMGRSFDRHAGAIDWIQSRFRHGRPATLYFDEIRCATYCDDLNRVFEHFLAGSADGAPGEHRAPLHGLFHCGGPRAITLFQIAQVVNRVGGYEPSLLKGCPRTDAGPIPPRAGNVSMTSAKLAAALGFDPFRPWPLGDDLVPTDRRWHFERPPHESNSFDRIVERLYHFPPSLARDAARRVG